MPFTGKSTYSAGETLPEIAEDVSDLVSINSPHETALLDALGDPQRSARSTVHEWVEDSLLPNTDTLTSANGTTVGVTAPARFRVGDVLRFDATGEAAIVTSVDVDNGNVSVTRGYGDTVVATPAANSGITIVGNAALEGADAQAARFGVRLRRRNYTQIFSSTVSVSGSDLAASQLAVRDELAWQKNLRSRELLRDLENSVINGVAAADDPQGTSTSRRTMSGLLASIVTNRLKTGVQLPAGSVLTEEILNLALRSIWKTSSGQIDLIVVGGREKRSINGFVATGQRFFSRDETYRDAISVYESDFGVCRVVLSRYVPTGNVLLLDSSRVSVLPLAGRSFAYTPLARTGDAENGQMLGEYTLECRNETAHGVITIA